MKESLNEFLKPTYFCESDDPEIVRLARKIVGKKKGKAAAVALFNWVRDNIKYDIAYIIGAKGVLKRGFGDCVDKTNLFVALCRASGISARYLVFTCNLKAPRKDLASVKVPHCAAEIFVNNKWVICDPGFEKVVAKVNQPSTFGRPTWIRWWNVNRSKSMPLFIPLAFILFLIFSKDMKKVKGIVDKIRKDQ